MYDWLINTEIIEMLRNMLIARGVDRNNIYVSKSSFATIKIKTKTAAVRAIIGDSTVLIYIYGTDKCNDQQVSLADPNAFDKVCDLIIDRIGRCR